MRNGVEEWSMERIFARAEEDLKTEQITAEVFAIIQGMK